MYSNISVKEAIKLCKRYSVGKKSQNRKKWRSSGNCREDNLKDAVKEIIKDSFNNVEQRIYSLTEDILNIHQKVSELSFNCGRLLRDPCYYSIDIDDSSLHVRSESDGSKFYEISLPKSAFCTKEISDDNGIRDGDFIIKIMPTRTQRLSNLIKIPAEQVGFDDAFEI